MIRSDVHVHTRFCDGEGEPAEFAERAAELGMSSLGFSAHSYTGFDKSCALKDEAGYITAVNALKAAFKGRLEIALGTEQDFYSRIERGNYDYIIGSVHYIHGEKTGRYYAVDLSAKTLENFAERECGGDFSQIYLRYYGLVKEMAEKLKPDVVGHFDLIKKFNKNSSFFDENGEDYKNAALAAVRAAAKTGAIFEVNTGGVSRGYGKEFYPAPFILEEIRRLGASVVLTSDAHSKDNLLYGFERAEKELKELGFKSVKILKGGAFADCPI